MINYYNRLKKNYCKIIANSNKISIFANILLTLKYKKMAYKISDDCAACGTCINECPVGAISEGDIYKIDADKCVDCGTCADVCPVGAINPA